VLVVVVVVVLDAVVELEFDESAPIY